MAQPSLLIQNLLNATREEYFYHSNRVDQIRHNDYPFQCCLQFLDKLIKIDEEVLQELDRIEKEVIDNPNYSLKESIEKIQRYGQLVGVLHYVLTFFEIGNREYIPIGTLVSLKNLIRKVDAVSAFTLIPIFDYNYIYLDLMVMLKRAARDALPDKIDEIFSGMPEKYAVFGFPLVMKNNVILNVILAHEVGHFMDDSAKISERILEHVSIDQKKIEKFAKRLEKVKFGERQDIQLTYFISPDTLRADIMKMAATHISDWLKELVADILAFHCFGPAYLQSVSDFLMIMVKIDEASGDHPSPRFRIKLLLEEFKDKGFAKISENKSVNEQLRKYIGFFSELNDAIDDLPQTTSDEFQEIVIDSVKKVIPTLKKEVTNFTSGLIYTPREFKADVTELSKHLDLIVPPVELEMGKTANPVSITNSGAFYKMMLINKLYTVFNAKNTMEEVKVRDKLHSLILKALELGDISEQMKKVLRE